MSQYFSVTEYRNAALFYDPNGQLFDDSGGPRFTRWMLGNAISALTLGSNLGPPPTSSYSNFTSPVRFPPDVPTQIIVFPVRVGKRFGLICNSARYGTGT